MSTFRKPFLGRTSCILSPRGGGLRYQTEYKYKYKHKHKYKYKYNYKYKCEDKDKDNSKDKYKASYGMAWYGMVWYGTVGLALMIGLTPPSLDVGDRPPASQALR